VLLVAFVVAERRVAHPMLDLTLFRKPSFGGASIAAFVLSASMFAMFLYLTLWVQNVLGYSALESGLRFLPITMVSFVIAPISGKLSERYGVRWFLTAGLALVGIGLLLMRGVAPGDDWTALLAGFLIAGAGIGMVNPAIGSVAVGVVAPAKAGMASGINNTFRQVGIATGIAGLGAIFQHEIASRLPDSAPSGAAQGIASAGPAAASQGGPQAVDAAREAFVGAFNEILLIGAIIAFAGAALGLLLTRGRDLVIQGAPEEVIPEEAEREPAAA
jgi:predicted MFS family arabinose efflux permease